MRCICSFYSKTELSRTSSDVISLRSLFVIAKVPGKTYEVLWGASSGRQRELLWLIKQPFLIEQGFQMKAGKQEKGTKWLSLGGSCESTQVEPPRSLKQGLLCTQTNKKSRVRVHVSGHLMDVCPRDSCVCTRLPERAGWISFTVQGVTY